MVTTLSGFIGAGANGAWLLYLIDDAPMDIGEIAGGWSLVISWADAVQPAQLRSPALPGASSFQTTLMGQAGKTYVIQASSDLITWTPIATNTLSGTNWFFTEPVDPSVSRRFFRAVCQPEQVLSAQ